MLSVQPPMLMRTLVLLPCAYLTSSSRSFAESSWVNSTP